MTEEQECNNPRKNKILIKMWLLPGEARRLYESTSMAEIADIFNEVRMRGDLVQ